MATPVPAVNKTGGIQTDDGRILFGFDAECYLRMKEKEDPEFEKKVADWIEKLISEELSPKGNLWQSLRNGIVLCKMLNKIKPGVVGNFNTKLFQGKLHALSERENITKYLESCWKLGLPSSDMFIVNDLHGKQSFGAVLNNISAISVLAPKFGCKLPPLGIKKIDLANKEAPKFLVREHSSVFVGEVEDDDVEELEEEIRRMTMKLEESQRTIKQIENSKKHLANLIKIEKQKYSEAEREASLLRSQGKGGDEKFVLQLTKQRDKLIEEIEATKKQKEVDQETRMLNDELKMLKDKLAKHELQVMEEKKSSVVGGNEVLDFKTDYEVVAASDITLDSKLLQDKLTNLEQTNIEMKDNFTLERRKLIEEIEEARKYSELSIKYTGEATIIKEKIVELELLKQNIQKSKSEKISELDKSLFQSNLSYSNQLQLLENEIKQLEIEKENELNNQKKIIDNLHHNLSSLRSEKTKEVNELISQINLITAQKAIVEDNLKTFREKVVSQLSTTRDTTEAEEGRLRDKLSSLKLDKKDLALQFIEKQTEYEDKLQTITAEYEMKVSEFNETLSKLLNEKLLLEQNFVSSRKNLEFEILEKETELKSELDNLKEHHVVDNQSTDNTEEPNRSNNSFLSSQVNQLKEEKDLLSNQSSQFKNQINQEISEQISILEKKLVDEKINKEKQEETFKSLKLKLETDLQSEVTKTESEIESLQDIVMKLESEKKSFIDQHKNNVQNLETEINKAKNEFTLSSTKYQNRIIELEALKQNCTEDKAKTESQLQAVLENLKNKLHKDQEILERKLNNLNQHNSKLLLKQKEIEQVKHEDLSKQKKQQTRFGEELDELRRIFEKMILPTIISNNEQIKKDKQLLISEIDEIHKKHHLCERNFKNQREALEEKIKISLDQKDKLQIGSNSSNSSIPPAAAKRIQELNMKLMMTETASKLEIQKLRKKLDQEGPSDEYKKQLEKLQQEAMQQQQYIVKLNKEIENLEKQSTSNKGKNSMRKNRGMTMRLAPVVPPPSIEEDLVSLREVMLKIMTGENVLLDDLMRFSRLFKVDSARRVFAFMLKEYTEGAEEGHKKEQQQQQPFIISPSSFDMLKVLIDYVLNSIDLRNGADFISGKILLETSSLIARQAKGGGGEEPFQFIQTVIKPHKCWENTFFWQEYFWTTVTTKFSLNDESTPKSTGSEEEKIFFEKELVSFAKVMHGWGGVSIDKLLLFIESLTDQCSLGMEGRGNVLTAISEFDARETKRLKSGHRKSRLFNVGIVQRNRGTTVSDHGRGSGYKPATPQATQIAGQKTFTFHLPDETKKNIIVHPNDILKTEIEKICMARGINIDQLSALDITGIEVDINTLLVNIQQQQIYLIKKGKLSYSNIIFFFYYKDHINYIQFMALLLPIMMIIIFYQRKMLLIITIKNIKLFHRLKL
eukprot:TRINITY_DN3925_c0_g1_i2.p1 TRINITY_DN3925_c0_g1~~TRINITY_DN3925_c0_g1_i2.p1  ORF type:complete len:1422 (-),score=336.90 TRINITY_DN3925_c0_g1_i2:51-4316(-)